MEELSCLISRVVLSHKGTSKSLADALLSHPSKPTFSPPLVDGVLKILWNDAPRALFFVFALLDHHPTFCPATSTLDHALDLAARARNRDVISRLLSLRRCKQFHNATPPPPSLRTFAVLMERYVSQGKADRAVRVFLSMPRQGQGRGNIIQNLVAFNTLLDALCKSRRVDKACSLVRALRSRFPPDVITYNILADGWCRVKRTNKAIETLRDMVESGCDPTLTTYNILLKGFFRAGQVKEALEFFWQMKRRSCKGRGVTPDVISYTTMVHGLGLMGHVDEAWKMFHEMMQRRIVPSIATYNALIQVLCKTGHTDKAINMFDEMVGKGCNPNVITYNLVIRGLCHASNMEGAMEFMQRMVLEGWSKPNVQTYNMLIRHWIEVGEIDKSLILFKQMGAGENFVLPDMDTYNLLLKAMFVRKRAEDMLMAGKLVEEMVEKGYPPRRFTFNRVLNGLLLTGNQEYARDLLRLQNKSLHLKREFKL